METFGSILEAGNVILFLIVFMVLALIPMLRSRKEVHQLKEQIKILEKAIERLGLEKDVYNPANHEDLADESKLVEVNQKHIQ